MSNQLFIIITTWIDIFAAVFTAIIGFIRYKRIPIYGKSLLWMIISACISTNLLSYLQDNKFSTIPLLYVTYFLDFIFISIFFNYSLPVFKKKRAGIFIMLAGILFLILNTIFYVPVGEAKNYFGFYYYQSFYSLCAIVFSILGMYLLFQKQTWKEIKKNPVFWFFLTIAFSEGIGFFNGIMLPMVGDDELSKHKIFYNILSFIFDWLPGDLAYIVFGILFLYYPKKPGPVE